MVWIIISVQVRSGYEAKGASPNYFFQNNVIVTLGGRGASHMTFCLPTKCRYIQTTLFGTVLQEKVGTIYDHPTNSV